MTFNTLPKSDSVELLSFITITTNSRKFHHSKGSPAPIKSHPIPFRSGPTSPLPVCGFIYSWTFPINAVTHRGLCVCCCFQHHVLWVPPRCGMGQPPPMQARQSSSVVCGYWAVPTFGLLWTPRPALLWIEHCEDRWVRRQWGLVLAPGGRAAPTLSGDIQTPWNGVAKPWVRSGAACLKSPKPHLLPALHHQMLGEAPHPWRPHSTPQPGRREGAVRVGPWTDQPPASCQDTMGGWPLLLSTMTLVAFWAGASGDTEADMQTLRREVRPYIPSGTLELDFPASPYRWVPACPQHRGPPCCLSLVMKGFSLSP